MLLGMFGLEPTTDVWIRVLGIVLLSLSIIYYGVIKSGSAEMLKHTMWARFLAGFGFCAIVLVGLAPPVFILFGAIDLITATWSWFELKK